jgi:hypothetical protein
VPSRKQRRRRQKELRHEYEFVVVDGEGRELESAPPAELRPRKDPARKQSASAKKSSSRRTSGSARVVKPPSWQRSGRRALLFLPLFFVTFSLVNHKTPVASRALRSLLYPVLFVPLTFMIDRASYRAYQRRIGADSGGGRRR